MEEDERPVALELELADASFPASALNSKVRMLCPQPIWAKARLRRTANRERRTGSVFMRETAESTASADLIDGAITVRSGESKRFMEVMERVGR
jgi:hypothetical protein